jgi:hypothetical protein
MDSRLQTSKKYDEIDYIQEILRFVTSGSFYLLDGVNLNRPLIFTRNINNIVK